MIGIYRITNKLNGKSYVGQSVHCGKRLDEHSKGTQLIDEIIQIEGIENFNFEILKEVEKSELNYWEDYFIIKFGTMFPSGYNKKWNCNKEIRKEIEKSLIEGRTLEQHDEGNTKTCCVKKQVEKENCLYIDFNEISRRIEKKRSFSDIVYVHLLAKTKIEKEKYRYLYCDTFTKTQVAKELGISRPTLNKKIDTLFKIGLIEERLIWSKAKKKQVSVWLFPPFNVRDFIDARTANFFTELPLYNKTTLHEKIIWLIFDLKRYWFAEEKNKTFTINGLLNDLNMAETKQENRIRIFNYLLLLQGLEIISFDVQEVPYKNDKQQRTFKYFVLTYFNDAYNKKLDAYRDLLIGDKEMEKFLNSQKRICDFNMNIF